MLEIITNSQPREILYGFQLPEKWKKEFDYLEEEYENNMFFMYKDYVYNISQFERIDKNSPLRGKGFNRFICDTYFSGILIQFPDDESVIVGRYYIK